MKDIFTIAIQYEDTYIINIELIKSETENHLDIKLNLDTKYKEIKDRVFKIYDSLTTYITEDEFILFLKDYLQMSSRVKIATLTLEKAEWIIERYKKFKNHVII